MAIFTKYTKIITPRNHHVIKAPADLVKQIYEMGYSISTSHNGKYASVYCYNPETKRNEYVSSLAYFINDKVCGYRDGNGLNLTKSNLITM